MFELDGAVMILFFIAVGMLIYRLIRAYQIYRIARRKFYNARNESLARPNILLTSGCDIDGFCCIPPVEDGRPLSFAPLPSSFQFYQPDIAQVLDKVYDNPPEAITIKDHLHHHYCLLCNDRYACWINTLKGHRIVCDDCEDALALEGRLSHLNYQQTVEAIFELALSTSEEKLTFLCNSKMHRAKKLANENLETQSRLNEKLQDEFNERYDPTYYPTPSRRTR